MATVKITKLVHSCLVIEGEGPTVLIDPGNYTWNDDRFDVRALPDIERVLITHGHPDHLSVEFVRELSVRFPTAAIETTLDVVDTLANHGIGSTTNSIEYTSRFEAPHEMTPLGSVPPSIGFHILNTFSHPGDSYSFHSTMPVLGLALNPFWGTMTDAVELARSLGPQYVVPIHDWHLRGEARQFINSIAGMSFADDDITYIPLDDFEAVSLDVT